MKKLLCIACAFVLFICAGIPAASAHGYGHNNYNCTDSNLCDRNKNCATPVYSSDGVCTNHCQFTDEDEDGICDHCNSICQNCDQSKDADSNGICDNCGTCSHFTDADNNGICDRHEDCTAKQNCTSSKTTRKYTNNKHASTHRSSGHHGGKHH